MSPNLALEIPPFEDSFFDEFSRISGLVFPTIEPDSLKWRLVNMPDVTVFTASMENRLVGFKAGYAETENRYYSWLGGIDPKYRKHGIAKTLMSQQHKWLQHSDYRLVETHVSQDNDRMVQLNHAAGLRITGYTMKHGEPYFVMQRSIT